jgi:transcriptional regulator with XRE-family HTH domain
MVNDFGVLLRRVREKAEIGQQRLALKTGIEPSRLSRIENRKLRPPQEEVMTLLEAIDSEESRTLAATVGHTLSHIEAPTWNALNADDRSALVMADDAITKIENAALPMSLHGHVENLKQALIDAAIFLVNPHHPICMIGHIGVGKSTAANAIFNLTEGFAKKRSRRGKDAGTPVDRGLLPTGGGGTAAFEFRVSYAPEPSIRIEPQREDKILSDIRELCAYWIAEARGEKRERAIPFEMERVYRNMAGLPPRGRDTDPIRSFIRPETDVDSLMFEISNRLNLSSIRLTAHRGVRYCSIYALVDPRQPEVWWYVGRSFHPRSRRVQHARGPNRAAQGATYKEHWIAQLLSQNIRPSVIVLEECKSLSDAIVREKIWIRRALSDGHPLTNSVVSRTFERSLIAMQHEGKGAEAQRLLGFTLMNGDSVPDTGKYSLHISSRSCAEKTPDLNCGRKRVARVIGLIYRAMARAGLSPNVSKTRVVPPGARKIVLGLLVEGSVPRLSRDFRALLRLHIYYLSSLRFGPVPHAEARGFISVLGLRNHVEGLVAFAHDIDPSFAAECEQALAGVVWPL